MKNSANSLGKPNKKRQISQISQSIPDSSLPPISNKRRKLDHVATPSIKPLKQITTKPKLISKISDQKYTSVPQNKQIRSSSQQLIQKVKLDDKNLNTFRSKSIVKDKTDHDVKEEQKADSKPQDLKQALTKIGTSYFKPKLFTDHSQSECASLTKWIEVTKQELMDKIKAEEIVLHRKKEDEETCPICMCELYDDVQTSTEQQIKEFSEKQMAQQIPIDVVLMSKCTDHCYHKQCLEMQKGQLKCLRCAVCSQIYGIMEGQQPKGKMEWRLHKSGRDCDSFKNKGTWEIRYTFPNGKQKSGINYKGTIRIAYLPDIQEGREILALLIKAFERKLSFQVGTSVTTGQTNVVVWNGIHHKTNTHGGSSSFGYPDATYFNRVKLELADRGVVLEGQTEVETATKGGKGARKCNV